MEKHGRNSWEGLEHYAKSWLVAIRLSGKELPTVECYVNRMNEAFVDFLLVTTSL